MIFTKIEGAGNDFIVMEGLALETKMIAKLCDRRLGIGADGLIFVSRDEYVKFVYYNSDGSHASFCGNGLRAVARFVGEDCTIVSECGVHQARVSGDEVTVNLPEPQFVKKNFFPIREGWVHFVHVGVPHAVVFVENFANFLEIAKKLRHDSRFGEEGANVHFAKELQDGRIEVRSFERGVEDETLACGSGGAAVFLSSRVRGRSSIRFASGDEVGYFVQDKILFMQGPARKVFTGEIYADWYSERDQGTRVPCGCNT